MTRSTFLTIAAIVACTIGSIALFLPAFLLVDMKNANPSVEGVVMARTAGAFLLSFGILNFLVRHDAPSSTLMHILMANALLQLLILPVDPLAYVAGVYGSTFAFIPNTILHIALLTGFIFYWRQCKRSVLAEMQV
ncbi:MAG: hypothetical protein AAFP98_10400 [Pseudomonadota bacterium]